MIQQRSIEELSEPQMRRESRIRHSFANVGRAVKGYLSSSERQIFYNVARQSCGLKPWKSFLAPLRMVARYASRDGRPMVIADTRALITEVFDVAKASVLAELPPEPAIASVPESIRVENYAECLSDPDEAEVFRDPSITNIERALPKLRLHRDALSNTVLAFEHQLNAPQRTVLGRQQ